MPKHTSHTLATSLPIAAAATGEIRAGGTDYMERRRSGITDGDLIDISRIPGLDGILPAAQGYDIGALTSIDAVSHHAAILRNYPGLAMSAGALATPQIRLAGTLGGSLLQRSRCWYYRHEGMSCMKKGGEGCPSRAGNHQYGVCFDLGGCVFPHPSTLGMVLMAYQAEVSIHGQGKRSVAALYGDGKDGTRDHLLQPGEILTQVHLPPPFADERSAYFRNIARARAEWPLVEVFVRYQIQGGLIADASVAIGGVAPVPLLLPQVAAYLNGKTPGEDTFKAAARLGTQGAKPLPMTTYKVEMVEGSIYETLRRADARTWGGEG